jgi:hypothetical protein
MSASRVKTAFILVPRYVAKAELGQNRHRRRHLAVRRAFAPMLIYQPDSGMLAAMRTLLQVGPNGGAPVPP